MFEDMFKELAKQTGKDFGEAGKIAADYAAERAAHLASMVGEDGFEDAVLAERDAVLLKLGVLATDRADRTDQRIVGVVQGALRMVAVML